MLPLGIVLIWGGYAVGSWGYLLVKGYNITLREWVSPLHPFTGPLAAAGTVPPGSVFPTGSGTNQTAAAGPLAGTNAANST